MSDELFEIKTGIGPIKLNLVALWRRLFAKPHPTMRVAHRFCSIFKDHGVEITQIPQFLPTVSLDKLRSPEAMLSALTDEVLNETSLLFNVRRSWLDGIGDQVYDCLDCYKQPALFFEKLASIRQDWRSFPVRALYSDPCFDPNKRSEQPIALLIVEKLREIGELEIARYHVFHDCWDWSYGPSRVQLKATARLLFRSLGSPVPLFRANPDVLERIRQGKQVPRNFVNRCLLTEPSLEDFALSSAESAKAREVEELPLVSKYIEEYDLEAVVSRLVGR